MGQKQSKRPSPASSPRGASSSRPPAPHTLGVPETRTAEQERQAKKELDVMFKQMAEENEIQMPALSRVKREKFVELKALKDLYETKLITKDQYEHTRDQVLAADQQQITPLASPFAPHLERPEGSSSMDVEAPASNSFAAFFNYAPERYRIVVEHCKELGQDAVGEDWWTDEVRQMRAIDQCSIFVSRLCAALSLPWRTVVTSMVLLHRYGHVLAAWAGKPSAEDYLIKLSLPNCVIVSSACVLLASKVEETLFSIRRLLLAIKQSSAGQFNNLLLDISQPGDPGKVVAERLSTSIKQHEIDMLMRVGFDITVEHPHHFVPLLVRLLRLDQSSGELTGEGLTITAFMVLDACIPTSVWLFHPAHLMALSSLFVAWTVMRMHAQAGATPADVPPFDWSLFNLTPEDRAKIGDIIKFVKEGCSNQGVAAHYAELKRAVSSADLEPPASSGAVTRKYKPRACRDARLLRVEETLDEGTYGCVSVAKDPTTDQIFAIKLLKNTNGRSGFPYYMLREVLFLQRLDHKNVVRGKEIVVERNAQDISLSQFSIVMEYVAYDLREVWFQQRDKTIKPHWTEAHIKHLMLQLLEGVAYMHQLGIMHRDIKLKNVLLDSDGTLKVADLGSIRETGRTPLKLTTAVVTLWYRPPELLLGAKEYTSSIDMWSIGCVFVELLALKPPFPGYSVREMMSWILTVLGDPDEETWRKCYAHLPEANTVKQAERMGNGAPLPEMLPKVSAEGMQLVHSMLHWDPAQRITAFDALNHPYFKQEPLPEVFRVESRS
eukprot:TRINITY_DN9220_c0_g1_i4.p1 TRINITY_DN9220_c0_g1~~TRINITY_DN9220_c0_g1_i4.p1  ORF type:complete len:806 (-),score=303.03 TRINITY_DN9220_c0_g1_i4:476-2809(-)